MKLQFLSLLSLISLRCAQTRYVARLRAKWKILKCNSHSPYFQRVMKTIATSTYHVLFIHLFVCSFACLCVWRVCISERFCVRTIQVSLQLKWVNNVCSHFPIKRCSKWKRFPTESLTNKTKSLNPNIVAVRPSLLLSNECELVNWSLFVWHHFKCNKTLMTPNPSFCFIYTQMILLLLFTLADLRYTSIWSMRFCSHSAFV